jgi:hypothetical protein
MCSETSTSEPYFTNPSGIINRSIIEDMSRDLHSGVLLCRPGWRTGGSPLEQRQSRADVAHPGNTYYFIIMVIFYFFTHLSCKHLKRYFMRLDLKQDKSSHLNVHGSVEIYTVLKKIRPASHNLFLYTVCYTLDMQPMQNYLIGKFSTSQV